MRKILITNLVLLFLTLLSNIYFLIDLNNNIKLVMHSEGLKDIEASILTISIAGDITHIVNNYAIYIISIGLALNVYFLVLHYVKNEKQSV